MIVTPKHDLDATEFTAGTFTNLTDGLIVQIGSVDHEGANRTYALTTLYSNGQRIQSIVFDVNVPALLEYYNSEPDWKGWVR